MQATALELITQYAWAIRNAGTPLHAAPRTKKRPSPSADKATNEDSKRKKQTKDVQTQRLMLDEADADAEHTPASDEQSSAMDSSACGGELISGR